MQQQKHSDLINIWTTRSRSQSSTGFIGAITLTIMLICQVSGAVVEHGAMIVVPDSESASRADRTESVTGELAGIGPGLIIQITPDVRGHCGLLTVRIPTGGTVLADAFCIDLTHHISVGDAFVSNGPVACEIAYILNLPWPAGPITNLEAAARQASIWSISDNFVVSASYPELRNRTLEILGSIPQPCSRATAKSSKLL